MRLAVCITSHNRAEATQRCCEALKRSTETVDRQVDLYLVDAGSDDDTVERVRRTWPGATVAVVDRNVFWAGGMRRAMQLAIVDGPADILWLNDDTYLDEDAIPRMLADLRAADLVVGATRPPGGHDSGAVTYGGMRRKPGHILFRMDHVGQSAQVEPCDTMNGNAVIVSSHAVEALGTIDADFVHALGDLDYGFRATGARLRIVQSAGTVAECAIDHVPDTKLSRATAVRRTTGPKRLPPRSWLLYVRRHAGPLWPAYFVWPYVRSLILGR